MSPGRGGIIGRRSGYIHVYFSQSQLWLLEYTNRNGLGKKVLYFAAVVIWKPATIQTCCFLHRRGIDCICMPMSHRVNLIFLTPCSPIDYLPSHHIQSSSPLLPAFVSAVWHSWYCLDSGDTTVPYLSQFRSCYFRSKSSIENIPAAVSSSLSP